MKEFFVSFMESSRDRIKNPIIGSFATAFIIYNWKAIVFLLFSKSSIEDRLVIIKYEYTNFYSLGIPIIFAFAYLLIIPFLSSKLDKILFEIQTERAKHRNKVKLVSLNNKIETAKLERQIADIKAGTRDIQDLREKNEELQKLNTENEDKLKKLESKNSILNTNSQNDKNSIKNLSDMLQSYENMVRPKDDATANITKNLNRNKLRRFKAFCQENFFKNAPLVAEVVTPDDIEDFLNLKLIFKHDDISIPIFYSLTPLGFKLYLDIKNASL